MAAKLPVAIAPLVAVFRNTETLAPPLLATTISNLPSPSKSPIAIERGDEPVVKSTLVAKLAAVIAPLVVVLRNTEAVELPFATAKSGFPSPLRSATTTAYGEVPAT